MEREQDCGRGGRRREGDPCHLARTDGDAAGEGVVLDLRVGDVAAETKLSPFSVVSKGAAHGRLPLGREGVVTAPPAELDGADVDIGVLFLFLGAPFVVLRGPQLVRQGEWVLVGCPSQPLNDSWGCRVSTSLEPYARRPQDQGTPRGR